jgi:hypothetical protein
MYSREKFLEILKAVGAGVGNSKVGEILNCVGFKDGKALCWTGVFGVQHLETELTLQFAVDYDRLNALVGTYTEDALSINHDKEKNTFTIENLAGKGKLVMMARPIDEFPFIAPDLSIMKDIEDDNFIKALEVALMSAGADPSKGVLWSVYFGEHTKGKYPYLMSSDNQKMTFIKVKLPFTNVIVPRPFCEAIVKMGKPQKAGTDGKFIYFVYDKVVMFGATMPGSYPNFEKVFATKIDPKPVPEGLALFINRAKILGSPAVQYDKATGVITARTEHDTLTDSLEGYEAGFCIKTESLQKALEVANGIQTFEKIAASNFPTTFVTLEGLEGFQLLGHMVEM